MVTCAERPLRARGLGVYFGWILGGVLGLWCGLSPAVGQAAPAGPSAPVAPSTTPGPRRARGADPSAAVAQMAEASLAVAVQEDLKRGRYLEAARQLALAKAPASARIAGLRAQLALIRGTYGLAATYARSAFELDKGPSRELAAALWAEILIAQGDTTAARRLLLEAERDGASAPLSSAGGWVEHHGRARIRWLLAQVARERGQYARERRYLRELRAFHVPALDLAVQVGATAHWSGIMGLKARALVGLHQVEDSYELFSRALQAEQDIELMVAWADAMLVHDHRGLAFRLLELALQDNPSHPAALLARATLRFRFGADPVAARQDLAALAAVNPDHVGARVLQAEIDLHEGQVAKSEAALADALRLRPADLPALSMRAAVRYLAGDSAGQGAAEAAVLERNPSYAELFMVEARVAEWAHRYADQVAFAERALEIAPRHGPATTLLGINLLRVGEEARGRATLERARLREPYNRRVHRMLALYHEVIDPNYVTLSASPFEIRISRAALPLLSPYVAPLLQRAYADMGRRYGIAPPGPLQIELYDSERDFAVRSTGLPRVGVQGVCFGSVITAISPLAASYNWGQILWHELSHVFHLQLSKHRVPRWFTEGLAEWETRMARPEWRREEDRSLFNALRRGLLPRLSQLDQAFAKASDGEALMIAYHTATLAVSYLVERLGFDTVVAMLRQWGQGDPSPAVLFRATGLDMATLDGAFQDYLQRRFLPYSREFAVEPTTEAEIPALRRQRRLEPGNAAVAARLAFALVASGDYAHGAAHARGALLLQENQPLAHFALSRVALQRGDVRDAEAHLSGVVRSGADSPMLRRMLALAAKADGRYADALTHTHAAIALDGDDLSTYRLLLELALEQSNRDSLLFALTAISRLDQHDRAAYHLLMAELARRGWYRDLIQVGEAAIYVDPASPAVHRHLAEAYAAVGQDAAALQEFEQLRVLNPKQAELAQFGKAKALMRLGRLDEAKATLGEALQLDKAPDPTGRGLLEELLQLPVSLPAERSGRLDPMHDSSGP